MARAKRKPQHTSEYPPVIAFDRGGYHMALQPRRDHAMKTPGPLTLIVALPLLTIGAAAAGLRQGHGGERSLEKGAPGQVTCDRVLQPELMLPWLRGVAPLREHLEELG